jgi:hypothetical protein
MDVSLL